MLYSGIFMVFDAKLITDTVPYCYNWQGALVHFQ